MSSSYHPQTDGQTERLNQCLEGFLRCTVHSCPKQWSRWLPLAEYWYNTSFHSALQLSPFEVLYGHPPWHFGIDNLDTCSVPYQEQWLKERELLTALIQQQLYRAQQRMKHQADKGRSEREFTPGEMVFLKLQPYIQSSVATRVNHKLSFRFFGPFRILQRVGKVAYKLDLPKDSKIHNVVHVSQLKKFVPPHTQVTFDLSAIPDDCTDPPSPIAVLDSRVVQHGSSTLTKLLVQWSDQPASLATWEELHDLHRCYPAATACGQAVFQGGSSVMTLMGQKHCVRG